MTTKQLVCTQCGGPVRARTGLGRTHEYRPGIKLPIPSDVPIVTCDECGETYLNDSEAERLEQRLQESYAMYCRALIDAVRARAGVTLRELERAAGVTPTYFSHVTSGRKQPSLTLVRLLQAFALHPQEVHRHLDGIDWQSSYRAHEAKTYVVGTYLKAFRTFLSTKGAFSPLTRGGGSIPRQDYSEVQASSLVSPPPQPSSAEAA